MDTIDLRSHAPTAFDGLAVDADAVLAGVHRRHHRYQRRRVATTGLAGLAVAGLVATVTVRGMAADPSPAETATAGDPDAVALTPYTLSATQDATALATVDGLELTYLPPGLSDVPYVESGPYQGPDGPITGGASVQACFGDQPTDPGRCTGGGLGVSVTRAPGLDLDAYQTTNWVGDPTPTTVGDRPALATGVGGDEASGLVWSPRDGVVVEIDVDTSMAGELRRIVDGSRLP